MSKLPRYVWIIGTLLITFGLIIITGISVHKVESATGIYFAERFPTPYGESSGYIHNSDDISIVTPIVSGAHINNDEVIRRYTYTIPLGALQDHQIVASSTYEIDTKIGWTLYVTIARPIGPVVRNSFTFSPFNSSDEGKMIHNFDKVVISAGWDEVKIYKEDRVFTFNDGFWSYNNYSDQPITVLMDGKSYATQYGFGGVCSDYNSSSTASRNAFGVASNMFEIMDSDKVRYPLTEGFDITVTP